MDSFISFLGDGALCLLGGVVVAAVVVKVVDRALGILIRVGGGL